MLKNLYLKYILQLNLTGFTIGLILLIISAFGIFIPEYAFVKDNEFIQDFLDTMGNYNYWLFIGMITLTIATGWAFFDHIFKLKKFNDLIKTTSKATFVRNQNEIEELAWKLGPKYTSIVSEQKRKFRIRN